MSERLPLAGRRIVVTRPRNQSQGLRRELEARGASVILFPVMRIRRLPDVPGLDEALRSVESYRWVLFTSANGVEIVWQRLRELGATPGMLRARGVAAIGPATAAALRERGVEPAFIPEAYVGESLGQELPDVSGERVLLARAANSRPALRDLLAARGAAVDEFSVYRAARERPGKRALEELSRGVDAITFTSPSTVRYFLSALDRAGLDPHRLPGAPIAACIGPVTAASAERAGVRPRVVATTYTSAGLVQALSEYLSGRESP
jgi:uroporphyrinogen-III synthase